MDVTCGSVNSAKSGSPSVPWKLRNIFSDLTEVEDYVPTPTVWSPAIWQASSATLLTCFKAGTGSNGGRPFVGEARSAIACQNPPVSISVC